QQEEVAAAATGDGGVVGRNGRAVKNDDRFGSHVVGRAERDAGGTESVGAVAGASVDNQIYLNDGLLTAIIRRDGDGARLRGGEAKGTPKDRHVDRTGGADLIVEDLYGEPTICRVGGDTESDRGRAAGRQGNVGGGALPGIHVESHGVRIRDNRSR